MLSQAGVSVPQGRASIWRMQRPIARQSKSACCSQSGRRQLRDLPEGFRLFVSVMSSMPVQTGHASEAYNARASSSHIKRQACPSVRPKAPVLVVSRGSCVPSHLLCLPAQSPVTKWPTSRRTTQSTLTQRVTMRRTSSRKLLTTSTSTITLRQSRSPTLAWIPESYTDM